MGKKDASDTMATGLAIFHGPRKLTNYDKYEKLLVENTKTTAQSDRVTHSHIPRHVFARAAEKWLWITPFWEVTDEEMRTSAFFLLFEKWAPFMNRKTGYFTCYKTGHFFTLDRIICIRAPLLSLRRFLLYATITLTVYVKINTTAIQYPELI